MTDIFTNNQTLSDDVSDCEAIFSELFSVEKLPIYYYTRFSLCVLDVIRKLQQHPMFEKGVEKYYIIEYLKHQPFIDGDVASQVAIALRDLENSGNLMYMKNGYKTLGPFAQLCASKTPKQRRLSWRKLELKLGYNVSEANLPPKKRRCCRSELNLLNHIQTSNNNNNHHHNHHLSHHHLGDNNNNSINNNSNNNIMNNMNDSSNNNSNIICNNDNISSNGNNNFHINLNNSITGSSFQSQELEL